MSTENEDKKYYEAVNLIYELSKSQPDIAEYISNAKGSGVIFEGFRDGRKIYLEQVETENSLNIRLKWLENDKLDSNKNSKVQDKGIEPEI